MLDALTNIACSLDYTLKIYETCRTHIRHLLLIGSYEDCYP